MCQPRRERCVSEEDSDVLIARREERSKVSEKRRSACQRRGGSKVSGKESVGRYSGLCCFLEEATVTVPFLRDVDSKDEVSYLSSPAEYHSCNRVSKVEAHEHWSMKDGERQRGRQFVLLLGGILSPFFEWHRLLFPACTVRICSA